jgi:spore coat protein H
MHAIRRHNLSFLPAVLFFFLLLVGGCSGTHVSPGVPCVSDVPEGMDPTVGVSFDPDHMLCVQVEMDEDDCEAMAAEARPILGSLFTCDTLVPSTFSWFVANIAVDGVALDGVGIRKKGLVGSVITGGMKKPSLKIKTDKFIDGQFLGDTERLTLNNAVQDAARMRACLAYEVFAAAGYPAPRCNLANVMINGESQGAYAHVETMKKRFLDRAFGDNSGSLYEGTVTDFVEEWLPRWEIKTGDTDPDRLPLRAVAQALQAPDGELLDALEPVLNVDRFITYWALEALIGHIDGYSSMRNNFYVYFDPTDNDRALLLPWGVDDVFSDRVISLKHTGLAMFTVGELSRRFSRIPEMNARFVEELEWLLDEAWDEATLLASLNRYAAQVRASEQNDQYEEVLTELRTWILGRDEQLRGMLVEGLPENVGETGSCFALGG